MANLSSLPPELWVMLMTSCASPYDLYSLVHASSQASRCFFSNKRRILKPYMEAIRANFGDHILSAALLAARLRRVRQEEGFDILNKEEAEEKVRSITLFHLLGEKQHVVNKLGHLCALSTIITNAEWITSQYAPQAWNNFQCLNRYDELSLDCVDSTGLSNEVALSLEERQKFYWAAFRFESYCQIFFRDQEVMFQRDTELRCLFFRAGTGVTNRRKIETNFYSIVYYVYDQHWSLLHKVIKHLGDTATPPPNTTEAIEGSILEHLSYFKPRDWVLRQFHLCRFRYRTRLGTHKLIHYLLSQGVSVLFRMQRMGIEDLTSFTIDAFYRVSLSHHPVIMMINGIEGHRKGIIGDNRWQPWLYIEGESYRSDEGWKCAESFWNQERVDEERRKGFRFRRGRY